MAYQLRFWVTGDWATLRPQENLRILSLALFSALFFGKIDRILPGGQALASMAGRAAAGWLMVWTLLVVLLALTKNAEGVSRIWLVTWLGLTIVTLWIGRVVAFFIAAKLHRAGYQNKTVLLYGDASMVRAVSDRIRQATGSLD